MGGGDELVRVTRRGPVLLIGMNRPDAKNAVNRDAAHALAKAFRDFDHDDQAKVAVFYGENGIFCAGADLKAMNNDLNVDVHDDGPMGISRMILSKPVIAAVSGYAVAGGLELACWCDLRVVEENVVFGVFCRRFGVPLIDGGTVRLPRLIGKSRALDMILTGRAVSAKEAYEIGLANRVVPVGHAVEEAVKLANEIASFPETCMRKDRMSVHLQDGVDYYTAMKTEFDLGFEALATGDALRGAAKFAAGKEGRHGSFSKL